MTEIIAAVTALIGAATALATSQNPLLALLFIIAVVLAWRLHKCEEKHEAAAESHAQAQREASDQNGRLRSAVVALGVLINNSAGRRLIDVASIEEIIDGEEPVTFVNERGPPPDNEVGAPKERRRRQDRRDGA